MLRKGAMSLAHESLVPKPPTNNVLFRNVRLFDGKSSSLSEQTSVLVCGNAIQRIGVSIESTGATVIDGSGRTLMPGLIDAHWHAMVVSVPMSEFLTGDIGYLNLVAGREAGNTLMRGFTSVRDMAGPVFGLKKAIDSGVINGPRIWPSGAMISQTSGHGDYRSLYELPRAINAPLSHIEAMNAGIVADGPEQVLMRTREQLMLGASQIKLAAGGGVASPHDPLDSTQYTEQEIRAAVEAARNWGTYVTVHAYTPHAIQTAIRGGVECIEHGHLMDEATAELIAKEKIWLCIQPFTDDGSSKYAPGTPNHAKQQNVYKGTETAYALARKYNLRTAWGTDIINSPQRAVRQGAMLTKLTSWYTRAEALIMATSTNAELLVLSGPRNPYPGKLGVVEEGALADLLLVDGDPIADIKLIETPDTSLLVIMKDGKIYKNLLH
jgi:imidazolonepropionase-like amidohydrolase